MTPVILQSILPAIGPILDEIPMAVVQTAIEALRANITFAAGEILITAGAQNPGLYLITSGTVELFVVNGDSDGIVLCNEKVLDFAKAGDTLAAETLFSERKIQYSVRALTAGAAIRLPDTLISDWSASYPAFGRRLMALVAQRIDYLFKDMLTLRTKKATARLVCYLVCHFDKAPRTPDGTHSLQIDIPKNRLASRLGFTDSHLSRALRELQDQGLLVARDGGYFIPNVAALSKYVCPMGCIL